MNYVEWLLDELGERAKSWNLGGGCGNTSFNLGKFGKGGGVNPSLM